MKNRNNNGFVLLLTLLLIALSSALICAGIFRSQKTLRIQSSLGNAQQARLNAQSGTDKIRATLEDIIDDGVAIPTSYKTNDYIGTITLTSPLTYKIDVWSDYNRTRGHATLWLKFERHPITTAVEQNDSNSNAVTDTIDIVRHICGQSRKTKVTCGGRNQKACPVPAPTTVTTYVYSSQELAFTSD